MSLFNKKIPSTKTVNLAGGTAYRHGAEMELATAVLATFLKDTFYEKGNDRISRITKLCTEVNPVFVAKLAVVARRDFHLRSVSHLLISILSTIARGTNLTSKAMQLAVERPDDLTEIASLLLPTQLPKQVKKGIRSCLVKFSPYQIAKYRMEGKKVKLLDLFNLTHPDPATVSVEQRNAWTSLMKGELKNEETWEARLSSGEDKAVVWKDMISGNKLGYMALLRNLRNIEQQADSETIEIAASLISDDNAIRNSKQLPFRFYSAYQHVTDQRLLASLSHALEVSLSNVPRFDGKTLIAVDGSGSMAAGYHAGFDKVDNDSPITKASIFAAALFKANPDSEVILFDTSIQSTKLIQTDSILTIADKIQHSATGGGTQTSLVFKHAIERLKRHNPFDRIIILSDNESWVERSYFSFGREASVQSVYKEYCKVSNSDPFIFTIDIAGNGTKDVTGSRIFHLSGWSERIFDYMKWSERENELINYINEVEL